MVMFMKMASTVFDTRRHAIMSFSEMHPFIHSFIISSLIRALLYLK